MIDSKRLDEVVQKVCNMIPKSIQQVPQDLENALRAALQHAFEKMDLVTREEFDVQTKVLARTREQCEDLKRRLQVLIDQ